MIRKQSSAGIGYSVVDLHDTPHVFASAVPRNGGNLHEQAHDALQTIAAVTEEEGTLGSIVKQAVFVRNVDDVPACREIIMEFYGEDLPATTYIPQPPCAGKLVAIEALGVGRESSTVEIQRRSERMVITSHNGVDWIHLANIYPETRATSVYDRAVNMFELTARGLASEGFAFSQVVRTWLYLGDIVGPEADTQRYMELNRARTDFFEGLQFCAGLLPSDGRRAIYPASTGIGTEGRDMVMSCMALSTVRDDLKLVPLENPQQTSAFDYCSRFGCESPKFARAMMVTAGDFATTFISGTASITGEETQFIGDVGAQTRQTLDNIEALIGESNLRRHGIRGLGATVDDLALVRVYIKNQDDYAKTRAVCEARLGELPIVYAAADVCRPELLVEIEGIAVTRRS